MSHPRDFNNYRQPAKDAREGSPASVISISSLSESPPPRPPAYRTKPATAVAAPNPPVRQKPAPRQRGDDDFIAVSSDSERSGNQSAPPAYSPNASASDRLSPVPGATDASFDSPKIREVLGARPPAPGPAPVVPQSRPDDRRPPGSNRPAPQGPAPFARPNQQPYNPYTHQQMPRPSEPRFPTNNAAFGPPPPPPLPTGIARTMNVGLAARQYMPPVQARAPQMQMHPGTQGNPIRLPSNPPPAPRPHNPYPGPSTAYRTMPGALDDDDGPDPISTPADAQRALQDLFQSAIGEGELEGVDMARDSKVEGFRDTVTLMPHQVQGRLWMKQREEGKARGGILADMGLGKTIQTLTRVVDGKRTEEQRIAGVSKTTLIIAPVGLIKQWASEITKMTVGLKVVEHHGTKRAKDVKTLERADVVITSYSIVANEYAAHLGPDAAENSKGKKKPKKKAAAVESDEDDSDSDDGAFAKKGLGKKTKPKACPLFEMKFLRVVLDEAQNIKNRSAKMSIACCALDARYRWALTGTPIQNNIEELFSLIKFLGIAPLNEWSEFKRLIADPVKAGRSVRPMKRLHALLKIIMLRRLKDQKVNGQALLNLPPRLVTTVACEFDDDEQAFYTALQERTNLMFNKFMRNGEVMKNYTSVLLLLLRLRQATNHPGLVSKDFSQESDAIEPKAPRNEKDENAAVQQEDDELADLFSKMGVSGKVSQCSICLEDLPTGTKQTVCAGCDKVGIAQTARRKSLAAFSAPADSDDDASIVVLPKKPTKHQPDLPPTSAKIRKIIELLGNIDSRSDGEEKTIIFSQFVGMLDLIEPFLKANGIRSCRIDGSMVPKQRDDAIKKIENSNSINVILISFKAGGTGLNLTCCNNVILVDLWWNPALEDQAFDRAHRLGQTRAVNIYKLVVENTVEDRILALQDTKRDLAKAALSGDKLSKNKLGLDDLVALFKTTGDAHEQDEDDD